MTQNIRLHHERDAEQPLAKMHVARKDKSGKVIDRQTCDQKSAAMEPRLSVEPGEKLEIVFTE